VSVVVVEEVVLVTHWGLVALVVPVVVVVQQPLAWQHCPVALALQALSLVALVEATKPLSALVGAAAVQVPLDQTVHQLTQELVVQAVLVSPIL